MEIDAWAVSESVVASNSVHSMTTLLTNCCSSWAQVSVKSEQTNSTIFHGFTAYFVGVYNAGVACYSVPSVGAARGRMAEKQSTLESRLTVIVAPRPQRRDSRNGDGAWIESLLYTLRAHADGQTMQCHTEKKTPGVCGTSNVYQWKKYPSNIS